MKCLAIITARGGSKRIPHKNIKLFCGKPILAYSIEAALESGLFEEVMVSTDDEQIAQIAREYGAQVPFMRSAETSNDYATTGDVLHEVVDEYARRGRKFDILCCIYPTAPFVTANKLQNACRMLIENHAQTVQPLVRFSFPPQRAFVLRDGQVTVLNPDLFPMRSQDLEPMYHDAGQFYFYDMKYFEGQETGGPRLPIELPETEVQDIDNQEDWELAEMKYQMMLNKAT